MARRRLHVRRHAAALAGLLVLLGLLELNQWLPGGWPGGGGDGGFREVSSSRPDTSRLRPPLGETPPPPREAPLPVTVRAATGVEADDWTFEARGAGFRLDGPGERSLEHGPATTGRPWTVHLPEEVTQAPEASEAPLVVRAAAAEDGRPLAGVAVTWEGWGATGEGATDAEGVLRAPVSAARLRVALRGDGRFSEVRWVDPRGGDASFRLRPRPTEVVRFVDAASGQALAVDHLRLLDREGSVWLEETALRDATAPRDRLDLSRIEGSDRLDGAVLEVGAPDHPVVRVALADVPEVLPLDAGRRFRVRTFDERGSPVRRRDVEAHYRPRSTGNAPVFPEGREVVRTFEGDVVVPQGVAAHLLVGGGASAPRAVDVAADAEPGRLDVRLQPGGRLRVRVLAAEDDQPLPAARVVVVAAVEGLRLERRLATDAEGVAGFSELPRGWVEVYAHAPDRAWAVATREIGEGEDEVVLRLGKGHALRLIVETPGGLPVEDVRVQAEPLDGQAGDVVPPGAAALRTDADGVLVLEGLQDRGYRVRLSRSGYRPQVLEDVRPGDGVHFVTLVPR